MPRTASFRPSLLARLSLAGLAVAAGLSAIPANADPIEVTVNRALWMLLGAVFTLLGVVVYWPPAQSLFHFGKLHWNDLAVCLAVGAFSLVGLEVLKSRLFKTGRVDPAGVVRS